ncbi:MAG: hypothetical protein QM713_09200 [Arachnia sp.]
MKRAITVAGLVAVVSYALWGALVVNDLGLVAGSGVPLDVTLSTMAAAGQSASMFFGYAFAVVGIGLAVGWAVVSSRRADLDATKSLAGWCVLLVLGAPAFFQAGFWNLNSLGDTFYDWHQEAVFQLERPLYITSGLAVLALFVMGALATARVRRVGTGNIRVPVA